VPRRPTGPPLNNPLSWRGRLAYGLDASRRVATSVVTTAIICVILLAILFIFYPSAIIWLISLTFGILSWSIGILFKTWFVFLKFVLAVLIATAALIGVCAARSWLDVRWIANVEPWNIGPNQMKPLIKDTIAVVSAVFIELLLPIFLVLVLVLLLFSLATLLLQPDSLSRVQDAISNIAAALGDGLKIDTSSLQALVSSVRTNTGEIIAALKDTFAKSAAIVAGAVSGGASLLMFLVKRRASTLLNAKILSIEVTTIIKSTVETMPVALTSKDVLVKLDKGDQVIVASGGRELLLLGSATAVKLPSSLLTIVVRFFHADLALTQVYASIGSEAFAKAAPDRRKRYLDQYEDIWRSDYQPAAFSALFRLALYTRLRAWSI
jgi:hypothetical protein